MSNLVKGNFGYLAELDNETRLAIQEATARISTHVKNTMASLFQIGLELIDMSELMKNKQRGMWSTWLETEFGWSESTAQRMMRTSRVVIEHGASDHFLNGHVEGNKTALYRLASSTVTDNEKAEAFKRILGGEKITYKLIESITGVVDTRVTGAEAVTSKSPTVQDFMSFTDDPETADGLSKLEQDELFDLFSTGHYDDGKTQIPVNKLRPDDLERGEQFRKREQFLANLADGVAVVRVEMSTGRLKIVHFTRTTFVRNFGSHLGIVEQDLTNDFYLMITDNSNDNAAPYVEYAVPREKVEVVYG